MPVDMLSDGLRNAIAMVADLAFRAYKLNPNLGERAALETPGVALIDEVDMFLHPSWQQTILASLRDAFPEVQFLVTTHSPQVISSVPRECIRLLGVDEHRDVSASEPLSNTYGQPSHVALHRVMQVDPQQLPSVTSTPAARDSFCGLAARLAGSVAEILFVR